MPAQMEPDAPPKAPPTGWEHRPEAGAHPMPPTGHPSDAIRDAWAKVSELKEFAGYYVSARLDGLKLTARRVGIYAAMGIVAAIAGATVLVVAVVLLLRGIAGAWTLLFPSYPWLGDILTGVIFLAIPVVAMLLGTGALRKSFRRQTVKKYERRQRHQREQFGRDVCDEAAAARGKSRKAH